MDSELKQHLEAMEARVMAHTEAMEGRLMARDEAMEARLMAHTAAMETRLMSHTSEECEKVETKLLTAFHKWGSTSDMRSRQALDNVTALNNRLAILEDRVTNLEFRPS